VAGITTAGAMLYRVSPRFWKQYYREFNRPIAEPEYVPDPAAWPDTGLHAAWLGHSTVFLKIDGFKILTDPVFSDRVGIGIGPVTFGLKRQVAPARELPLLPKPDLVLLSHAHMDHFDIPSLRALEDLRTPVITAWETSDLLRPGNYASVREIRWNQELGVGPATIRAFEVNHWGARMRTDSYRGYNGYRIRAGRHQVLFAGDTANTDLFRPLRSSEGYDLAIMPIGAYNPWIHYHCTPEQAWRMGNEAGAEFLMPVHHQTFKLSNEPNLEPIERFHDAAGNASDRVALSAIGQEFHI